MWDCYERVKKNQQKVLPVDGDLLAHAVLYLCRAPKNRTVDEFAVAIILRREQGWRLEVPDYALDMHTQRGRAMGRGEETFWPEGARLENEVAIPGKRYREEAQQLSLQASRKVPTEQLGLDGLE